MTPIHEIPGQVVVKPDLWRIDSANAEEFRKELEGGLKKALERRPHPRLVVDFANVNFMSSAGLRQVINVQREAKTNNRIRGGMILRFGPVSKRIQRALDLAGFLPLFKTEDLDTSEEVD